MDQLSNPQIALAVRQRHPYSVQQAVSITIELESLKLKTSCFILQETTLQGEDLTNVAMQVNVLEALQKLLS